MRIKNWDIAVMGINKKPVILKVGSVYRKRHFDYDVIIEIKKDGAHIHRKNLK